MVEATKSLSSEGKEKSKINEKHNAEKKENESKKLLCDEIKKKENISPVEQINHTPKIENLDQNQGEERNTGTSEITTKGSETSTLNGFKNTVPKMDTVNSKLTRGQSSSRFKMIASKVIKIQRVQTLMAGITLNIDKSSVAEKESNVERKALLASISWLSYHVPECVVVDLSKSIEKTVNDQMKKDNTETHPKQNEDSTSEQIKKNENENELSQPDKKVEDSVSTQLRQNFNENKNFKADKIKTDAQFKKESLKETNLLTRGLSRANSSSLSMKSNENEGAMETYQIHSRKTYWRTPPFYNDLSTITDTSVFSKNSVAQSKIEFDSFMSIASVAMSDDTKSKRKKKKKKKKRNQNLNFKKTPNWDSFKNAPLPETYELPKRKSLFKRMKSKFFKRKKKQPGRVDDDDDDVSLISHFTTPISSFAVPLRLEDPVSPISTSKKQREKSDALSKRSRMNNLDTNKISPVSTSRDQNKKRTESSSSARMDLLDLKQFSRPTLLRQYSSKKEYSLRHNSLKSNQEDSWKSVEKLLDSENDKKDLKKKVGSLSSTRRQSSKGLPLVVPRKGALLFVDISGFTKLATLVTIETLSSMITDEINSFGGDVLKFAGDAVFAEWKTASNSLAARQNKTLDVCVTLAAKCGAQIVSRCADFPIFANAVDRERNKPISTLNVHCGLGVGELTGVHVGNNVSNRELIIIGDPIDQVAEAEFLANLGELVASPKVMEILKNNFKVSGEIQTSPSNSEQVIATPSKSYFEWDEKRYDRTMSSVLNSSPTKKLHELCCFLDVQGLRDFRKLISLYVHKVVVNEDDQVLHEQKSTTLVERINAEAELRPVYVMFINMPLINARLSGDSNDNEKLTELLNDIFLVTVRELERFKGHLRQFIVDDKGVVLIATFGLRGSTSQNMITRRALPATKAIQKELLSELNVVTHIGATMGDAYCGIVGGVQRHEYAVLGSSVNLAARLMASKENPGILVDDKVRLEAGSSFVFNALGSVKARGYDEPVQIFEPVGLSERKWKKVDPYFAERDVELKKILSTGKDILLHDNQPSFFLLCGEELSGKSSLLAKSAESLRIIASHCDRPTIFLKYVNNDTDSEVPLGTFKFIFREFLDQLRWENYLFQVDIEESNPENSFKFFKRICNEINVPDEVIDFVQRSYYETKENGQQDSEHDTDWILVTKHLARIIIYCLIYENMLIIALDDVHNMDAYSWGLLKAIFEYGSNLMIICSSLPSNTCKKTFKHPFWIALEGESHFKKSRYEVINLEPLSKEWSRTFCKNKLDELDIDEELINSIVQESKGIPGKLIKLIEEVKQIKEGNNTERLTIIKDELKSGQIADIFMHQIDSLDPSVRKTLQVCAVLGDKFTLHQLVAITEQWLRSKDENARLDHARSVHEHIKTAVMELILDEIIEDESSEKENGVKFGETQHPYGNLNQVYCFCHHSWRENILSLMLESHKDEVQNKISIACKAITPEN